MRKELLKKSRLYSKYPCDPIVRYKKNEMLKCSQLHVLPCIVKLFNLILSTGVYPESWKIGYIRPIFKGDDPCDPTNYRGIAVMPCLSKLFNAILNTRLQSFLDSNEIINNEQIGFQPKARTSDHMFVLRTLIEKIYWK